MRVDRDTKRDKGQRRRRRLGAGPVTGIGPNHVGRWLFLHAVTQCVPEAVQELVSVAELGTDDDGPLTVWADHWGFTDLWALATARTHVALWKAEPRLCGRWLMLSMTGAMRWEPVFPLGPSWNPITETEAAFDKRVKAYKATCLAMPGLTATPEKETVAHFEWLALHHVKQWTYEHIAHTYANSKGYPDVPAISRAITDTAALVGLTLRPGRGRKLSPA